MPTWLAIVFALSAIAVPVLSAWALHFYKMSAESRDKKLAEIWGELRSGFARNDLAMASQTRATEELRDRVGKQNGRLGILEAGQTSIRGDVKRLEERQWGGDDPDRKRQR